MNAKLKLSAVSGERSVKITVELPASVFRDLTSYAEAIGRESNQIASDPAKLVAPMIQRFMASDKGFRQVRGQLALRKAV